MTLQALRFQDVCMPTVDDRSWTGITHLAADLYPATDSDPHSRP